MNMAAMDIAIMKRNLDFFLLRTVNDKTMNEAAIRGDIKAVKRCKAQGATNYYKAMRTAEKNDHLEIVKLCRGWLGYNAIHNDLLRHYYKN